MSYDLVLKQGLNFSKGHRSLLRFFARRGNNLDYYYKTSRGLGYVTTPMSLEREQEEPTGSEMVTRWDSDVSTSTVLQTLTMNMVQVSYDEQDES